MRIPTLGEGDNVTTNLEISARVCRTLEWWENIIYRSYGINGLSRFKIVV